MAVSRIALCDFMKKIARNYSLQSRSVHVCDFFFVKSKGSLLHKYLRWFNEFSIKLCFSRSGWKNMKVEDVLFKRNAYVSLYFLYECFFEKIEIINLYFCWEVKPGWHCLRVRTSLGCYVWLTGTPLHRFLHQFRWW